MKHLLVLTAAMALLACAAGAGEEVAREELALGSKAPAFTLKNAVDGSDVSFQPGDGKTTVVIFTCNTCPYAKAFEERIVTLADSYAKQGVRFLAVNPNDDVKHPGETTEKMKERAAEKKFAFPYLKDGSSATAAAYGARVTPHVFVVDGAGVVRYRGYVDDSAKAEERTDEGLRSALDDMIAQREVKNASTKAFGCTIKWKKS